MQKPFITLHGREGSPGLRIMIAHLVCWFDDGFGITTVEFSHDRADDPARHFVETVEEIDAMVLNALGKEDA